jgi:hypothetical protein
LPVMPHGRLVLHFDIESEKWHFELSANGLMRLAIPPRIIKLPTLDPGPLLLRGAGTRTVKEETAQRWDDIALTPSEGRVLDTLQMIAPIRGVSLVGDPREHGGRMAKVRVDGTRDPVPLAVLGDGVVRMFQVAVALEYAGIARRTTLDEKIPANVFPLLLIDEVEMGIHYSLHPDLWRLVFKAARDLDVQVFATTHSWDCIKGFQEAAAEDAQSDGMLIRLEAGRGKSRAFLFSGAELAVVAREQIEVR